MNKQISIIALATLTLALGSCGSDESGDSVKSTKNITVSASIGELTRATTNGDAMTFDDGDRISVYAWTGVASEISSPLVVNNVVNSLSIAGGKQTWTPASQMLWADMVSTHYFLGVYPERAITDFKADPYTLDPDNQSASDLLIALNTTGLKAQDNPVSLNFTHTMAKLIVNLNFRNQWEETPEVKTVTAAAKTTATVDYATKTITATGSHSDSPMPAISAVSGYSLSYSSVMIPQDGFNSVTINVAGKNYVFTNSSGNIPLESGKYTVLSLIVGRNTIDLSTVSILDWKEGQKLTGEILNPNN